MKSLPARDPNREALATAITLHAGAARDLQVAKEAASLASERCWNAQSKLDELRNEPPAPSGAFAAEFTASIVTGNPCTTATLERASVAAGARLAAAENDAAVWNETRQECDLAVRAKEADVVAAKEQVGRAARVVICDARTAARLADGLAVMQAEIIERRSALRFISRQGCNGELAPDLARQIERLMWQDLSGGSPTDAYDAWQGALDALMTDAEAALPTEIAGAA